ncbi:E3 ubiquitin-protein ligase DZIP3-like [Saccostrea cucullata]|uniref:E3 ubiquitin-protein ligase DZIP3-like n=1 Tax=Saccostrea cuccullata TaxID=36930 RepID=UPI002ED0283C
MEDAPSSSVLYFHPNKSTENFARLCQFLMTICCDVMREILSHYIEPANLRTELDQKRSKMEKIANKQEKDLLYPPHSSTSSVPPIRSRDLDISMLYKILRNLCSIPKHKAGWGKKPRPSDFSLAACIERIRISRNSISGHSTNGMVDDKEFENYWRELRTSVVEIEKEVTGNDRYEREIDHLYDCDLNPTKSKEYLSQIQRNTGELKIKRERMDLVEGKESFHVL